MGAAKAAVRGEAMPQTCRGRDDQGAAKGPAQQHDRSADRGPRGDPWVVAAPSGQREAEDASDLEVSPGESSARSVPAAGTPDMPVAGPPGCLVEAAARSEAERSAVPATGMPAAAPAATEAGPVFRRLVEHAALAVAVGGRAGRRWLVRSPPGRRSTDWSAARTAGRAVGRVRPGRGAGNPAARSAVRSPVRGACRDRRQARASREAAARTHTSWRTGYRT